MKQLLCLLILATLYSSCKKEDDSGMKGYHCYLDYHKIGGSLGFIGYSLAEMDTIYVAKYQANTGFNVLLASDTFVFNLANSNTVTLKNDTIYLNSTPARQPSIEEGTDYLVFMPGANAGYTLTQIGYRPFDHEYYSETPCKGGINLPASPDSAWVDGRVTYAENRPFWNRAFFLSKK